MFKKKKKSRVYRFYRPTPPKKAGATKTDYAIFVLILMLGCFTVSLAKKWGEEKKGSSDIYEQATVRVQILNASGNSYMAETSAQKLAAISGSPITFEVVEKGDYGAFKLPQSMIVYLKEEEEELACQVADFLGINRENVLFQKVEDNYLDIQMKLIVGRDFKFLEVAQAE